MTRTVTKLLLPAICCAFALGSSAPAQDPGENGADESKQNPQELARQIRRNMQKIEEDLNKALTHDPSKGEQVRKDLEKLLDTMKQRQGQVVKDIDSIVEQMKCSGGGGSGSKDSNENQGKSKPRDRNKPQNQSKPRDPNGGQKPKDGKKPSDKKGSGPEDNRPKPQDGGENQPGDPRGEPPPERWVKIDLNEIWGNLPPELRQKLVDRNFDDFTPEYKAQIDEYFRKTSTTPKK